MKNFYYWCIKNACILGAIVAGNIIGINTASAQFTPDYSNANYAPLYVGKIIPNDNTYADNRRKIDYVYDEIPNEDRLPDPVMFSDFSVTPGNGGVEFRWRADWEPGNLKLYEIEYSKDGITFQQVGVVPAGNYLSGRAYEFRHFPVNVHDRMFYRLRIVDQNGRYAYTTIIPVAATGTTENYIFPTIVNAGTVSLYLNDSFKLVQIVDMQGRILQTELLEGRTGRTDIPLSKSATGICIVRVVGSDPRRNIIQKIFIR
jgi:hypothetical protein